MKVLRVYKLSSKKNDDSAEYFHSFEVRMKTGLLKSDTYNVMVMNSTRASISERELARCIEGLNKRALNRACKPLPSGDTRYKEMYNRMGDGGRDIESDIGTLCFDHDPLIGTTGVLDSRGTPV